MSSLVSIVIPTYNRAHLLGETLDSVLVQTYGNWECIVVDDGSNDYTEELMEFYLKDPRIKFYHRPKQRPKGANACRNFGFNQSKGAFIQFLDSDDIITPNCLNDRVFQCQLNYEADYLIKSTGKMQANGSREREIFNIDPKNLSKDSYLKLFLSYQIPWQTGSVFWRRNVLDYYSFDENLSRLQDVDFHIRVLLSENLNGKRIFEIDNFYRLNCKRTSSTNHIDNVVYSFLIIFEKILRYEIKNYNQYFKKFILFVLFRFMYINPKRYNCEIRKIEKFLLQENFISQKQAILLFMKRKINTTFLRRLKILRKLSYFIETKVGNK
ncbi:glycosyltransferase family 2 protein [uncultured Christiangramia sp.]|uniref:glycosyltransferase family 2 protein n=1 Tax=Christiangramia sp. 3-2217-3z TaxID=3417564 RepID=UPI002627ACC1|nr:glycosyltransferase family 2 protein [uncultured Christiangramia sp.]